MSTVPQIPNEIVALFQQANANFAALPADTGEGFQGEWPPEGECVAFVLGVDITPGSFREKGGAEVACADVTFRYQVIPDHTAPDYNPAKPGLEFRGARMQIVDESRLKDDGAKTRAQIDKRRLKGFLLKINGAAPADLLAGVREALAKVSASKRVALRLFIEYREGQSKNPNPDGTPARTRIYKTDFARELISE